MLRAFRNHIQEQFPFLNGKLLLVAVSGGIDSIVLAHLLHRCKFHIALAHANFGLRGAESDADEVFVTTFSKKLGVALYTQRFKTDEYAQKQGISIQMAARTLRYEWFETLRKTIGFNYILTAHHADDNLETFFINLSRGAGLEGLTGIPEQKEYIIRPMLPFPREAIAVYAKKNQLSWREDSSNLQPYYLRNKIRLTVIPKIKEISPSFLENFQQTIAHLKGSRQLLHDYITRLQTELFQQTSAGYTISLAALKTLTPQPAYLYELFKEFGFTDWKGLRHLLNAPSGKQLFSSTHRLLKDRDWLFVTPLKEQENNPKTGIDGSVGRITRPFSMRWNEVSQIERKAPTIVYVDKETLKFPLTIRKWKKGDYFYPFGMNSKKKISKFFKDEKYSLLAKESQWLLCSGDAIVWVIGKRADNRFRVTSDTRAILKIEVEP